ncbi:MAG: hypothetical protein A2057_03850 [Ignavibacteria bacterium GWA2_35_9]|nr:MAG: hypothetical protein A2057_03850 [Ignavibacteria bacterium GWA2_35_9]OGU48966.1 MAG: hypothetical protein A2080_14945 [Ignavibacteria bacterium GWC2_36_12]HJY62635.1 hypothetical protein [Ignavibacteria bacterium]
MDTSVYYDSVSGSITVELNEAHDAVTNVSVSLNIGNQFYNSNNQFIGDNIQSVGSSSSTFKIEGTQTCDQISSFTKHTVYEDREETLESFECDVGGEHITIYFSK